MNRIEALVGLNLVGGIGTIRLKRLLEFFGKSEKSLTNYTKYGIL